MGLVWHEEDSQEEAATQRLFFSSRRALLCALILCGLLLMLALGLTRTHGWLVWLPAWAVFLWSLAPAFYITRSFMQSRKYFQRKKADLGVTDLLTGLPNRKGLMAELEKLGSASAESGRRIRLVDVDLMNLNRVNYEFGQMVGDAVLQDVAGLVRAKAAANCIAGRLGGDEFLVLMPAATSEDAEALANALREAIAGYKLSLGERGEVNSLKARVSVADYVPERASLHETVVSAKESTAHGQLVEAGSDESAPCYHVPRVTLGAFAVHRWQNLSKAQQEQFKVWKREPGAAVPEPFVADIARLLDEKAEVNWADFVTAVPAPTTTGVERASAAGLLAQAIAAHLNVPYREVMRVDASGPESRSVEPAVDAVIDKGDSVLLVSDVISSGIVERRCVKKLAAAGAHVQVIAWAAY